MTNRTFSIESDRAACGARRLVYGYVRTFDPYQIVLERRSIQSYCERSGFDLVRIIEDPCQTGEVAPCRSFLELACALELEQVYGVVMPDLAHLSENETVRAHRLQWIGSLDRQVFVVPKVATIGPGA